MLREEGSTRRLCCGCAAPRGSCARHRQDRDRRRWTATAIGGWQEFRRKSWVQFRLTWRRLQDCLLACGADAAGVKATGCKLVNNAGINDRVGSGARESRGICQNRLSRNAFVLFTGTSPHYGCGGAPKKVRHGCIIEGIAFRKRRSPDRARTSGVRRGKERCDSGGSRGSGLWSCRCTGSE